ncbi:hypothetical protein C1H46_007584 [Malus baccata]|uniref:Uncharacterized protein n=1 Tax=Malus baccata TaxID=106549 RepID=A0A540N6X6_MALBA|nr:hypothetical protein C1H46_007584 [Malus baccata]
MGTANKEEGKERGEGKGMWVGVCGRNSGSFNPSQVQAHDPPRLRISNGLIKPDNGKLVELFVDESKKGETKKDAMTL